MEIFLSLPITSNLDQGGVFKPDERAFYQSMLDAFAENDIMVRSAVINEDWARRKLSVFEFTKYDVDAIAETDALVAVTRERITRDIMLEIGLAVGHGKLVAVALPDSAWTTHMLDGLSDMKRIQVTRFDPAVSDGRAVALSLVGLLTNARSCRG